MPTKDSQKTEDMLDQTFANFDTGVTGDQTQEAPIGSTAKANGAKKSSNMAVFIGAGVAAVGAVAYLFVIKPMLQAQPAPVEAVVQAPTQQPEVTQPPANLEVPTTAPNGIPADQTAQVEQIPDPAVVQPQTQPEQSTQAPINTTDVNAELNAQLAQPAPANVAQPAPAVVAPVTTPKPMPVVANTPANAQSVAVVDDLKGMFDKQTNEFKTILTEIDTRIIAIEGSVAEQREINQKVDQRLIALEGAKKSSNTKTSRKIKRTKVKKPTASVEPKGDVKKDLDASILVDNTASLPKVKTEKNTASSSLPKLAVHSIYGGRLWIKNNDGSLSTFTSGDRLPSGETIKSIDDENFEVTTDKRVIKN